jgi:hypothetical protein
MFALQILRTPTIVVERSPVKLQSLKALIGTGGVLTVAIQQGMGPLALVGVVAGGTIVLALAETGASAIMQLDKEITEVVRGWVNRLRPASTVIVGPEDKKSARRRPPPPRKGTSPSRTKRKS